MEAAKEARLKEVIRTEEASLEFRKDQQIKTLKEEETRELNELKLKEDLAREELRRKQEDLIRIQNAEKCVSKEFSEQEKEVTKEFKEEKSLIKEKVTKTTDVEMVVVGNIEIEEQKPSLLNRLKRKVKKMFGGQEVEVEEEYEEETST